jgi:hypothetical protein
MAASLDSSPGWADLLTGASSPLFLNLVSLAASTCTFTKQPQIQLTKTFIKQLCTRWRLDVLAFPLDFDSEFILQPPATTIKVPFGRLVCVFSKTPSIQHRLMLCTTVHPVVVSTAFRWRVRRRLHPVTVAVLIRSMDHVVIKSSLEDFFVNLAA